MPEVLPLIIDGAKKRLFNALTDTLPTASAGFTIFPVWAEESADLNTNAQEWAFGNGNDTPANMGVTIPVDCELFAMGLSLEGSTGTVRAVVNGNIGLTAYQVAAVGQVGFETFATPLAVTAGQRINFRTVASGGGATNGGLVVAWFRVRVSAASTSLLNDLMNVSVGTPGIGQSLTFDGTQWVPENKLSFVEPQDDIITELPDAIPANANKHYSLKVNSAGDGYEYFEEFEDFITEEDPLLHQSNANFAPYLTLNTDIPVDGDYELTVSYYFSINNTNANFLAHIEFEGDFLFPVHLEGKDSAGAGIDVANTTGGVTNTLTDQFIPVHRSKTLTLTAGPKEFVLEFRGQNNNLEPTIYEAEISIRRRKT